MTYTNWDAQPPTEADLDERIDLFVRGRFDAPVVKVAKTRAAKLAG